MPQTLYCDPQDVIDRLSEVAVELRLDDTSITDVTTDIGDCIEEASAEIDADLGAMYAPAQLAANPWVQFCCRAIACQFLCLRRGQGAPDVIAGDCERYRAKLALFATNKRKLPNTPRTPGGPAVSNQSYDNTKFPALRIERPRSTPLDRLPPRLTDPNADAIRRGG